MAKDARRETDQKRAAVEGDAGWAPPRPDEPAYKYPAWANDLIAAGWVDPTQIQEMAARGFDVSSPESWQASLGRFNEEEAMTARDRTRNDQFGNDMAWLDPAFQREAATVRPTTTADALQFGVTADPEAVARQNALLDSVLGRGLTADPSTEASQRSFLSELEGRGTTADPRAEAAQYGLLSELEGRGRTSDAESEDAQRSALDELLGLYRQGGQGAQDRAARARNRADTENWLQGQRQADIQDRAERGMSGSGGEILDLLADRQAAASRLSAGDLEADAAAERRALEALLAGTDLATGMRSASDEYEAANTRTRADVANQARSAADAYQGALDQTLGSTLEGMRTAADRFSVDNDRTAADLASGMREASDRFVEGNADRLGDAAEFNAKMINDAASEGKQFLQDAYADTMRRRDAWDRGLLDLQTDVATGTRGFDAGQNEQGFDQSERVGQSDVGRLNNALDNFNTDQLGIYQGGGAGILAGQQREADAGAGVLGGIYDVGAETGNMVVSALGGAYGGGGMPSIGAMGGAAPQANRPLSSDIKDPWEEF